MHDTGDWLDEREDRVWSAFFEMQVLFWRRLAQQLQQDTGLSEPDLAILTALVRAPEGQLRAYELSDVTQFEKSRLHHHLTRMARRGLVTRESCPESSRASVIAVTPEGRAAITDAAPKRAAHIRQWLIDPLDAGQLDTLAEISEAMRDRLLAAGPPPGARRADCADGSPD
ncbi:MarR family winged helix-turn-helix transcriptional regulator [Streptosporangium roseum]|uniref:MarR-family regulatory protein n=1 Tax=Streptosporangium roseum (strain ATCC 12428 / DSM 43021 / JCM 3005 / KCTC 9067 / NCIMB 10171 / NRRL 2505 / NI 9100) TaxID=479432 RepID=D2B6C1_STRRD|nr:MarR family winged helix-turn-helix transcriptional regulator [Streptosporangium roseum]ACZ83834.1 putative MarR-family regulatory protein [Streptosporangium roseum DSM 43021]